jgi:Arc/MetJ family transcription regulator
MSTSWNPLSRWLRQTTALVNIEIDDRLMRQALRASGRTTKRGSLAKR